MQTSDYIGFTAAALTTFALFPQAIKMIRTKSVQSISLTMSVANSLGILAWLIYGINLQQWPIILANSLAIVPALTILVLKIRWTMK